MRAGSRGSPRADQQRLRSTDCSVGRSRRGHRGSGATLTSNAHWGARWGDHGDNDARFDSPGRLDDLLEKHRVCTDAD
jgi:hypothetical protein